MQRKAPPWSGPPEVIIYARKVIIALSDGEPIDVQAPASERYRLRIAPAESPPASLHIELDDGTVEILRVVYVPPSLAERDRR